MRTTVNLDDDVLSAARSLAAAQGRSLGEVLSDLARRGLRPDPVQEDDEGMPVFKVLPGAGPLTPEMVRSAMEDAW